MSSRQEPPAGPAAGPAETGFLWPAPGPTTGSAAEEATGAAPDPRAARRVVQAGARGLEALLAGELAAVRQEIEDFRAGNPDTPVEIIWRAVDAGGQTGGATVPGPSGGPGSGGLGAGTEGHR